MNPGVAWAFAPGRVNLLGDHTDYVGGLAIPMAIDLGTRVEGRRGGSVIRLSSTWSREAAEIPLHVDDPRSVEPEWARYIAGVASELAALGVELTGFTGIVRSTVPVGAGLSSSAALEVATALALGFEGSDRALAELAQRAEHRASGVPCGIMDQLTAACGVAGHALLMDFTSGSVEPVPMPDTAEVVVVHSGQDRSLTGTAYAQRRDACLQAVELLGALRAVSPADLERLDDPVVRRRARHVVSENTRVIAFADALRATDLAAAGQLMYESHTSLRDDFEVSTDRLDLLVEDLMRTDGVYGARLTGAGFGGCAVALSRPGTFEALESEDLLVSPAGWERRGWRVRPSAGAHRA